MTRQGFKSWFKVLGQDKGLVALGGFALMGLFSLGFAVDFDAAVGGDVSTTVCSIITVIRRVVFALVGIAIIRGIALAAGQNERGWAWILTGIVVGFINLTFPTWAASFTTNCTLA